MEKVGILVVSYGAREVAMIDAFTRSINYNVEIYVVDKQRNPFNIRKAVKHVVIPDFSINKICKFVQNNKNNIDFGIVGSEKPIIAGLRDLVEIQTGIPLICPTKDYAIESSKVQQRLLFQKIMPEVNPRFKIFNRKDYKNLGKLKTVVFDWLTELENNVVVKPDQPAAGKGVGVWGDHFVTRTQLFEHFLANLQHGSVIIEEKIEGEESSFQAFCDGKHLVPLPDTRDYKRAFDDDKGPNTGGMGSYKSNSDLLPFMTKAERYKEIDVVNRIFEKWKASDATGLRGVPFYVAFMHTGKTPKILENNSRPGDPEIQNLLPILKEDFVDICFNILSGNLRGVRLEKAATVVTYKVPSSYGGYIQQFPHLVNTNEINNAVDLTHAYALNKKFGDKIRVYPAAMNLRKNKIYPLSSRAICVVGIGDTIKAARRISLEGIHAIKGGALWHRTDIASEQHIGKSIKHMRELRRKQ